MNDLAALGNTLSVWFLPVVLAITLHEAAHGWMAARFGDDTARRLGRVTMNPIRHVDPVGTLLVPGMLLLVGAPFLFGWAKPVPVAFHRLHNPKRDMIWVALAGPGINVVMATIAALMMHLVAPLVSGPGESNDASLWVWQNLQNAVLINIVLACFNMLPLPPLDGGRVVTGMLPARYAIPYARIEPYGIFILLGVVFIIPMLAGQLGLAFNPFASILLPVVNAVYELVLTLTGW